MKDMKDKVNYVYDVCAKQCARNGDIITGCEFISKDVRQEIIEAGKNKTDGIDR